ncbi:hypothetical protein KXR53_24360 [Inquilinus limosus]|uniref:hypothetical protein n=1 Tax=Inquilinus limosus TaxID=171674 RepID=UPI003F13D4FF
MALRQAAQIVQDIRIIAGRAADPEQDRCGFVPCLVDQPLIVLEKERIVRRPSSISSARARTSRPSVRPSMTAMMPLPAAEPACAE